MAAACRGSTVDRHLEETILRLPSHLTEMERHRVTANVAMCELFIRRTEDYASGLTRSTNPRIDHQQSINKKFYIYMFQVSYLRQVLFV